MNIEHEGASVVKKWIKFVNIENGAWTKKFRKRCPNLPIYQKSIYRWPTQSNLPISRICLRKLVRIYLFPRELPFSSLILIWWSLFDILGPRENLKWKIRMKTKKNRKHAVTSYINKILKSSCDVSMRKLKGVLIQPGSSLEVCNPRVPDCLKFSRYT